MTASAAKWERRVEALLGVVASVILLAMMLLTFVDVVARYIFSRPVRGAFEVTELKLDPAAGEARVVLDDGSEEVVGPDSLGTDARTGRVECLARGGRARAAFSRAAHQALLEHVEETRGHFFLRVGSRRLSIRAGA